MLSTPSECSNDSNNNVNNTTTTITRWRKLSVFSAGTLGSKDSLAVRSCSAGPVSIAFSSQFGIYSNCLSLFELDSPSELPFDTSGLRFDLPFGTNLCPSAITPFFELLSFSDTVIL
jgi:hypothetical protein